MHTQQEHHFPLGHIDPFSQLLNEIQLAFCFMLGCMLQHFSKFINGNEKHFALRRRLFIVEIKQSKCFVDTGHIIFSYY